MLEVSRLVLMCALKFLISVGVGWGNVMQEMLLNHQLALKAGRS